MSDNEILLKVAEVARLHEKYRRAQRSSNAALAKYKAAVEELEEMAA